MPARSPRLDTAVCALRHHKCNSIHVGEQQVLGRPPRSISAESGGTRCTEGPEPCDLRVCEGPCQVALSLKTLRCDAPILQVRATAFSSLGLLLKVQFGQGRHGSHEIQILTHRITVEDHVVGERSGALSLVNNLVRFRGTQAGPSRGGHETLKVQDSGHRDFVVRGICCCPWPILGRWCAELPHVKGGLRRRGAAADPRELLSLRMTGSKPRAESLQCWVAARCAGKCRVTRVAYVLSLFSSPIRTPP